MSSDSTSMGQQPGATSRGEQDASVRGTLLYQMLLARASDLARSGQYSKAESLLSDMNQDQMVTP